MALGTGTFNAIGGAVNDLFAADALRTKAAGSRLQAQEYDLARELALRNEQYTKTSTEIKDFQAQRGIEKVIGQGEADVASSGFESSGSALDLMRDSAAQGALTRAAIGQQGLIEEAGYREQAQSFELMAKSARMAADAQEHAAVGATWSAGIKAVTAVASVLI